MPKKQRQATRTTPGFTGPFKGAAQQGTLFDKRTVAKTGDEVGPRGYSVNRVRAIKENMPPVGYEGGSEGSPYGAVPQWKAPHAGSEEDTPDRKTIQPHGPRLNQAIARGESKMVDTLARSTMPVSDLKGVRSIISRSSDPTKSGMYSRGDVHLFKSNGTSRDPSDEMESHPERTRHPKQRGPIDPDSEITLLHELGHHASALAKNDSAKYKTNPQQAAEEGRADNYALTHYRQDPRQISWQNRFDPREHTYLARGNSQHISPPGEGGMLPHYRSTFGGHENDPVNSKPYGQDYSMSGAALREREDRPMLDEHLPEGQQMMGRTLSKAKASGWIMDREDRKEETPMRQAVYKMGVQKSNKGQQSFSRGQAALKQRWGVNRNLGRQWDS